jgi:hypothetical protein
VRDKKDIFQVTFKPTLLAGPPHTVMIWINNHAFWQLSFQLIDLPGTYLFRIYQIQAFQV